MLCSAVSRGSAYKCVRPYLDPGTRRPVQVGATVYGDLPHLVAAGFLSLLPSPALPAAPSIVWPVWPVVVCIATGPSLTRADALALRHLPTIAVNDAYRVAPHAQILYAADKSWWDMYNCCPDFTGRKVSQNVQPGRGWPTDATVEVLRSIKAPGMSRDPGVLHRGYNSGYQALNLALLCEAKIVVLLGYDCGQPLGSPSHYFGDHPAGLQKCSPYDMFRRSFTEAAPTISARVINVSRQTTLDCFERMSIGKCLTTIRKSGALSYSAQS